MKKSSTRILIQFSIFILLVALAACSKTGTVARDEVNLVTVGRVTIPATLDVVSMKTTDVILYVGYVGGQVVIYEIQPDGWLNQVSSVSVGDSLTALALHGELFAASSGDSLIKLFLLSSPHPLLVDEIQIPGQANDLCFVGDRLFAAMGGDGLWCGTVSGTEFPDEGELFTFSEAPLLLGAVGDYLAVCHSSGAFWLLDPSSPSSPLHQVETFGTPKCFTCTDSTAWILGNRVYKVGGGDPLTWEVLARCEEALFFEDGITHLASADGSVWTTFRHITTIGDKMAPSLGLYRVVSDSSIEELARLDLSLGGRKVVFAAPWVYLQVTGYIYVLDASEVLAGLE